jgi:hypothetical protein
VATRSISPELLRTAWKPSSAFGHTQAPAARSSVHLE